MNKHYVSIGCNGCRKELHFAEAFDFENLEFKKVMDKMGKKNFCNEECKLTYIFKKLSGDE